MKNLAELATGLPYFTQLIHSVTERKGSVTVRTSDLEAMCKAVEAYVPTSQAIASQYAEAEFLFNGSHPNDEKLRRQADIAFGRVFADLIIKDSLLRQVDYFRNSRLSLLDPSVELKTACASTADDFTKATGYEAQINTILGRDGFKKSVGHTLEFLTFPCAIVDRFVSSENVKTVAEAYRHSSVALGGPANLVAKRQAFDLLSFSPYGKRLLQQVAEKEVTVKFVDLTLYNRIKQDITGRVPTARALYSRTGKGIFVKDAGKRELWAQVSSLAHEAAHVTNLQISIDCGTCDSEELSDAFRSLREGHSIATQFIVASEQIEAGLDPKAVQSPLDYKLTADTINLLCHNPAEFIRVVSQSEIVQKTWNLSDDHRQMNDALIEQLAATLPLMRSPWVFAQPQQ